MGVISGLETRSSLANPEKWLVDWFGGGTETTAGVRVTTSTAMQFVAVFACINILSRTVGSLPLYLYRRLPGGGKEKARNHPLFNLIRYLPNAEMTSMRYRSTLQGHLAAWGNCYSYIDWAASGPGAGYPRALWPIRPDRIQAERLQGRLEYRYYPGIDDFKFTQSFIIPNEYMLHIPGFGFDGVTGYSPVTLARESIGLGMAANEFGSKYFGSGTHPGMIVEHPNSLSAQAHANLKKSLSETHSGLGNAHKLMLLEEGMKATKITIDPKDSQFLETRKYQVTEIARLFLIPPHMIAELDRSTNNNIEHQGIEFIVNTMRPWFVLWEEEYMRTLLRADEREEYFFMFDTDALTRGDIKTQYEAFGQGKQWGFLSTNDIRDKLNMNPVDGGDVYMVPLNMMDAKDIGKLPRAVKEVAK